MAKLIKIGDKYYSYFMADGKRIKRVLSKYKPEAERLLREMVGLHRANKHGEIVRNMSWSQFRELRLANTLAEFDKNTYYANRRAFDIIGETTHLTQIKQMSPERLGRLKTDWINSGKYSQTTISRSLQAILASMRWAEDLKYIQMQNWRTVKSRATPGRTDYWTREGYVELLSKIHEDWFTAALIMGRAGLRLGEMLHLEWEDIHFESNLIIFRSKPHIVSAENPNGWRIKKDKPNKIRSVPMLYPDLRQHLNAIRRPSGFVLGPKASRLEHGFSKQFSKALKDTGVKTNAGVLGFPHLLRHTFGSHLAQMGVAPQKIQAWMGHESGRMTERYSHLSPLDTATDINMVEKLCATFVPGDNSIEASGVLLTTLNEELGNEISPS